MMLRLRHNLYVTRTSLRTGKLELSRDPVYRHLHLLWFRNPGPNFVLSCRYGPLPRRTKELISMSNEAMDRYRKFLDDGVVDQVSWPDGDPPEGIPSADIVVEVMLQRFCDYVVYQDQANGSYLEPGTFVPGNFYMRKILAAYHTYYWVVVVEVYDGDDGGSSVLTGYWSVGYGNVRLDYLMQEYEAMITVLIGDGEPTYGRKE